MSSSCYSKRPRTQQFTQRQRCQMTAGNPKPRHYGRSPVCMASITIFMSPLVSVRSMTRATYNIGTPPLLRP